MYLAVAIITLIEDVIGCIVVFLQRQHHSKLFIAFQFPQDLNYLPEFTHDDHQLNSPKDLRLAQLNYHVPYEPHLLLLELVSMNRYNYKFWKYFLRTLSEIPELTLSPNQESIP